jgi:Metallo-peptidase family M12
MAPGERRLDLDARALDLLRTAGTRETVRLERFPFALGSTGVLLLERFEVATPDATVRVHGPGGESSLSMPAVAHFSGRLEGEPESRVYVGIPGGFLVALLQTSAGLVYVGPDGPVEGVGPVQHVLRRSDSPANAPYVPLGWTCDVEELSPTPPDALGSGRESPRIRPSSIDSPSRPSSMAAGALRQAAISVETDQELLAKFGGNVEAMSGYVSTLFGAISVIYERDVAVRLSVNRIEAWTTMDPYSATSPRGQLEEVGDWWHANRPRVSHPRTVVHFLSGKPVSGGIAFLDVLCQSDYYYAGGHWGGGYGVTQIYGNYPASLWDLFGTAHELGHNFGSPHTHCFSPPIDTCYGSESGCYGGPPVNPGPHGGTIMSYCHALDGGYGNIDMRFHERCINEEMLPEINSGICLTPVSDSTPAAMGFYTLTPCRIADTRNISGPYGGPAMLAGTDRVWGVAGHCGLPSSAKSVAVNVTVTAASQNGSLRLYAAGTAAPPTTSISYRAGRTRANNAIATLGSSGGLAVRCDQPSGVAHVILDVFGYFQ